MDTDNEIDIERERGREKGWMIVLGGVSGELEVGKGENKK